MGKLTDTFVRAARLGAYEDGDGLRLVVKETTKANEVSKTWLFRYQVNGRRREMGMGVYPATGLKDARKATLEARALIASGVDPIDELLPVSWTPRNGVFMRPEVYHGKTDI